MPKNINVKSKRGFTIIEVVLVLAVAGLIFLMVFIALPALQRSQRDTQRRNDYGMLSSAITSYSASNGGKIYRLANATSANQTTGSCYFLNPKTYINGEGTDPNGYYYQLLACNWAGFLAISGGAASTAAVDMSDTAPINSSGTAFPTSLSDVSSIDSSNSRIGSPVYVVVGADCEGMRDGHSYPQENSSSRAFVVYGFLESGNQTYCNASQ